MLAGIVFDSATGEVLLGGTPQNDRGIVSESGGVVAFSLNGFETQRIPRSQVQQVWFVGSAGDDYFENKTSIPSKAFGNEGNDTIIGGSGADHLAGNSGNDRVIGNGGNDLLSAGIGKDRVDAGGGNDRVFGIGGTNLINAGAGNDVVFGGEGVDTVNGGDGDDELYLNGGDDIANGDAGNDIIGGSGGNDVLSAGSGNDRVYGGAGNDRLTGNSGKNTLVGASGDDEVNGGTGADTVYGGTGDDLVTGGAGNDRLFGQEGDDQVSGDAGDDFIMGNAGHDELNGNAGNDRLFGMDGHDVIRGGSGNDQLRGGNHNDSLYGESGRDLLFGEHGFDGLFGGVGGNDVLDGGSHADRFVTHSNDTRKDFSSSDVQLKFVNGSNAWTNKEIEVLDQGLGQLHRRTSGVRVLRNTLDKNPLTFYKESRTSSGNPAQNELQMAYQRDGRTGVLIPGSEVFTRKISFADWDTNNLYDNEFRVLAAIHEVGHNWDSAREINSRLSGQGKIFSDFLAKSNWRSSNPNSSNYVKARGQTFEPFDIQFDPSIKNYRQVPDSWWHGKSAKFARNYGATNPLEDWATVWEAAFAAEPDPAIASKLAVVNRFLNLV